MVSRVALWIFVLGCGQCFCFVSGRAGAMDLCVDWVLFASYGGLEGLSCLRRRGGGVLQEAWGQPLLAT